MVVTIGKYITPKHMDINGNGIQPDFDQLPGTFTLLNFISGYHQHPTTPANKTTSKSLIKHNFHIANQNHWCIDGYNVQLYHSMSSQLHGWLQVGLESVVD